MVHFREVQRFHQPWFLVLLSGLVLAFGYALFRQLVLREPVGGKPMSDSALVGVTAAVLIGCLWLCLAHLVTEVTDDELSVRFVFLWRPKRIPFSEIRSADVVTYSPIRDYGGWGIRHTSKGWAYNVSGRRGVQLVLADGEHLLIGSQRADDLAHAIRERMQR